MTDLRPQHFCLPRTNRFRDFKNQLGNFKNFSSMIETVSQSKKGKILACIRLQKPMKMNIKSYRDTMTRWKPMHWICLLATFKKMTWLQSMLRPIHFWLKVCQLQLNWQYNNNKFTFKLRFKNMNKKKWKESLTNYLQNIFPRNLNTDLLFFTSEPFRSTQDEATRTQVPPLLSLAFSPSLATMPHDSIWLTLCLNFCCSSKQEYILRPGSFRGGLWKISEGTRSCRSGKYYEQRYSSLVYSSLVFWMKE